MANQNFKVKKGLEVGTGVTISDGGVNITGVITAAQFSGDGSGLTGVTAAGSGVVVQEEGSNVGTAATINFIGSNVTAAISGGVASVTVTSGSSDVVSDTTPQLGGNLDLNSKDITGTGNISITGGFNATGVSTFQESVTFQSHASFGDNDKANFGAGNDLQIYHSGTTSYIKDAGTGNLNLDTNGSAIVFTKNESEDLAKFITDGAVELYYDNSKKFETSATGVDVTGRLLATGSGGYGLVVNDSTKISLGSSNDLQLSHNGTNSYIDNGTGSLYIRGASGNHIRIQGLNGEESIVAAANGSVDLYYDNSKKFETTNTGIDVTGEVQCDSLDVDGNADISGTVSFGSTVTFGDHDRIRLGDGQDLDIYHDSNNSVIDNHTGHLYIRNNVDDSDVYLLTDNSSGGNTIYVQCDGSTGEVGLRHYGTQKLATKSTGVSVTGTLAATAVTGDGSGLTSLTGASAGTYGASTNTPIITVDSNGRITGISTVATAGAGGGGGISNIVEDTTPQLGGNLDLNSKIINGSGNLDYTGNLKVTGISTITGVAGFSSHITLPDHAEIQVGSATGGDLKIYHTGSHSYIKDAGTGDTVISTGRLRIVNAADNETLAAFTENGSAQLYHNNALRLKTTGTGVDITDDLNVAGISTFSDNAYFEDEVSINMGTTNTALSIKFGNSLKGSFTPAVSSFRVSSNGSNDLRLVCNDSGGTNGDVEIATGGGNGKMALFTGSGTAELYYQDSKKFETTNTGVTVTGTVAATAFSGDGSALTNLPASGITTSQSNTQVTYNVGASGNNYVITGPGYSNSDNNPDLYLVRGQRYRFINATGSSHPFRIQSDTSGTAYTDGVSGSQSGTQEFNVQHNAPSRLFYQCTIHSGMIGNIYITGGGQWENTSVAASGTPEIYTDYNVGIGTDNPGERLHLTTTSGNCKLRIDAASAASVDFYNSGTRFSDMFTDAGTGNFTITNRQNADIILRTNGTNERVYIKSSGEVSMGGFTPTAGAGILQISGGLRVAGSASASDTTSPYIYRTSGYDHLNIATNGVERFRISDNGAVGINTTADTRQLEIYNSSHATAALKSDTQSSLFFSDDDTNIGQISYVHASNYMYFRVNDAERLRIDSSGRVKIGSISNHSDGVTQAPVYIAMQTDITGFADDEGNATAGLVRIEETGSNNSRYHGIELRNTNSGDIRILNQDVNVNNRGDLVIAMPDGDADSGIHNKIRFNSVDSSIQISGKGGAVAGNGDVNHTDIYIATKTGVTAIDSGVGGEIAGLIRFEDIGSNNNRYHGIEIRNRNSGDARILNLDEGTTNKSNLVFAIDDSGIKEVMRLTSEGETLISNNANRFLSLDRTNASSGSGEFNLNVEVNSQATVSYDDGAQLVIGTSSSPRTQAGFSEKVRVTSGGHMTIGSGATDNPGDGNTTTGATIRSNGKYFFSCAADGGHINRNNAGYVLHTRYQGNHRGGIYVFPQATQYNTSSDYRLKENVVDISGAITRIKELAPRRFNFISEPGTTVDGFIAHEAATVVPEAVTGTKDEVDSNGDPAYQGIDNSKFVPLLTAALQEAIAKIETLEAKVAALEG